MEKRQINFQATPLTDRQLQELRKHLGMSQSGVIRLAIDRLHIFEIGARRQADELERMRGEE